MAETATTQEETKESPEVGSSSQIEFTRVRIGEYVIDFNERIAVDQKGEEKTLTINSLKLLTLLLTHNETYVPAKEIQQYLYGSQYKDDSSTRKQLTVLRKIFNDSPRENKYVDTKQGHGYRLVADVEVLEVENDLSDLINENLDAIKKKRFFWLMVGMSFLVIFVVLAYSIRGYFSSEQDFLKTPSIPLTHLKGLELFPDISPDGNWIAFSHQPENTKKWHLYVRDMKAERLIQLTGDEFSVRRARWSNDGNRLIFAKTVDRKCVLTMATLDKVKVVLKELEEIKSCKGLASQAILWPDGKGMYFTSEESATEPYKIHSYNFSSKTSWVVSSPPPSGKGDYYLSLSESGDKLAVLRNKNWIHTEIWLYDTQTWETRLIDTVAVGLYTISWAKNDRYLVYKDDHNQVIKHDLYEHHNEVIGKSAVPFLAPLVIDKEKLTLIAIKGGIKRNDILKKSFTGETLKVLANSSYRDELPAVSKDGTQFAWISNRTGTYQVWYQDADEFPVQVTQVKNIVKFTSMSFSNDGTKIGGTASGRWFVYDIKEGIVTWSEQKEGFLDNFQWRTKPGYALLLRKFHEEWKPYELEIDTGKLTLVDRYSDAYLVLEINDSGDFYTSSLQKNGFKRVINQVEQHFPSKEPIGFSYQWLLSDKGLYFANDGELFLLPIGKNEVQKFPGVETGRMITMPYNANWFITEQRVNSDTEIIYLNR